MIAAYLEDRVDEEESAHQVPRGGTYPRRSHHCASPKYLRWPIVAVSLASQHLTTLQPLRRSLMTPNSPIHGFDGGSSHHCLARLPDEADISTVINKLDYLNVPPKFHHHPTPLTSIFVSRE